MSKPLKIGLFGFGCVGQGLYDIFQKTEHFNASITRICVKNMHKNRSIPASCFTYDKYDILNDPDINCIVELIDDSNEAFEIVSEALRRGKDVVTANKKMLAYHLKELIDLQNQTHAGLLYEGSSCGSIPIIRNLEEYYDHEPLLSISGIFNGSSNYILSRVFNENLPYAGALEAAQQLGFAESDPILDVGGFDAKFKLIILTAHSFGRIISPDQVLNFGIENLASEDVNFAREKNFKIKLVAQAKCLPDGTLNMFVLPHFIQSPNFLYNVEYEFNAVNVETTFADKQYFYGKGAGGHPTGAAVLSDISALSYQYRYEYKKYQIQDGPIFNNDIEIEIYLRYNARNLPERLGFTQVLQRFESGTCKYVIGILPLKNLMTHRDLIFKDHAFIAMTTQVDIGGRNPQVIGAETQKSILNQMDAY